MSSPDDLLRQFARETEALSDAKKRVADRLSMSIDPTLATDLLRSLPDPDDSAIARVLAQVRESIRAGQRMTMPFRTGPLVVASAAFALLAVGLFVAPKLIEDSPPVMIAATLEAAQPALATPAPGVRLEYTGWGFVSGSQNQPRLQWGAGSLHVEVEPNQGIDLRIETPNGEIQVVGTVFDVDVDDLGTRVHVARGKVRVVCELGETTLLTAGQNTTCVRASAANVLNFAVQARTRGGTPGQVLSLASQGLTLAPEAGLVRDELRLVKFQSLLQLERRAEARAAADDYLLNPQAPRRVDVLRTTAKLAFAEGNCPAAVPYLSLLSTSGGAAADDLVPLARCLGRTNQTEALELLARAEGLKPSPSLQATIDSLRGAILDSK